MKSYIKYKQYLLLFRAILRQERTYNTNIKLHRLFKGFFFFFKQVFLQIFNNVNQVLQMTFVHLIVADRKKKKKTDSYHSQTISGFTEKSQEILSYLATAALCQNSLPL